MALAFLERSGLNSREQRFAGIALLVLGILVVLAIPVGLQSLVSSRASENDELRGALAAVNDARSQIGARKSKRDAIAARYGKKTPPLAGFLEQQASTSKLQVTDSVDRPDIPHGKRYTERNTVIHLKKSGMAAIARFLESLEKSGHPVSLSRLNIRKRAGEADSYDVEVGVSAFDRTDAPASAADKDKK
jgi:general secretion pathway protein M